MLVLVKYLDIELLRELRETFQSLDTDGTGTLSIDNFESALEKAGYSKTSEELESIVRSLGRPGREAEIHYSDFLAATISSKLYITDQHLWEVFKHFDIDDTG
jgi:calcium-dependent protein kinase